MFKHLERDGIMEVFCGSDRLDIRLSSDLRAKLEECFVEFQGNVIFNLEGVAYMDSSIIGILIHFRRRLDKTNRNLTLTCLSGNVLKIFELTKLISFFDVK